MAGRPIKPVPKELRHARQVYSEALWAAHQKYRDFKIALGYCSTPACPRKAKKGRRKCQPCLDNYNVYHKRLRHAGHQPNKGRVHCDVHGNWKDVCGCK